MDDRRAVDGTVGRQLDGAGDLAVVQQLDRFARGVDDADRGGEFSALSSPNTTSFANSPLPITATGMSCGEGACMVAR
ncbi:hypothetical protein [Microterricola viridarii]|uniref:Uncharacterized protein n=1 Tax=Microterricola viridarii TaxID=412690 RepID=A0A0Y0Q8V2_9MICO|nr:hypothetical protein [Microterricola viridarii]AMB59891.1 hypothetical protein AWU67_14650 [Microterricola viridarii]